MALFSERRRAQWEGRAIEVVTETHALRGLCYRLVIDGDTVASRQNWLKRPGRFVLSGELDNAGVSHRIVATVGQGLLQTNVAITVDGVALAMEPPSQDELRIQRRRRWFVRAALAVVLPLVGLSITAALPTFLGRVAAPYPAFAMRAGRRPVTCNSLVTRHGCAAPEVRDRQVEDVSFATTHPGRGLAMLNGSLTLPVGPPAPHPAVLLIGGSGGHPRDPEVRGGLLVQHEPFRLYGTLTRFFTERGFAVLTYDKRTCHRCYPNFTPDFPAFRFAHFEDDARAALAFLRSRPDVDGAALVLVGHSQGGGIAARLAGEERGVAAVIMLAGSTRAFADGLSNQLRRFASLRLGQLDLLTALLLRRQANDFDTCLATARQTPDQVAPCLHGVSSRAFDEEAIRAATTAATIASLPMPFLALQGQLDRNIDPEVLLELREPLHDRDAELHLIAGVGHTLVHHDARQTPTLAEGVTSALDVFVRSVPHPRFASSEAPPRGH